MEQFVEFILEALSARNMNRSEILGMINAPDNWYYKKKYLDPLISYNLIEPLQEKKNSPKQSYAITEYGLKYLNGLK